MKDKVESSKLTDRQQALIIMLGALFPLMAFFALTGIPQTNLVFFSGSSLLYASGCVAYVLLGFLTLPKLVLSPIERVLVLGLLVVVSLPFFFGIAYLAASARGQCLAGAENAWDIAYFSYVAFTTVGFGDIQPVGICRGIASIEAVAGYLALGAFVGSIIVLFNENDAKKNS